MTNADLYTYSQYAFLMMPELVLLVFGVVVLVFGAVVGNRGTRLIDCLVMLAFVLSASLIFCPLRTSHLMTNVMGNYAFKNMFVDNGFTGFVKVMLLVASALSVLLSLQYNRAEKIVRFEYSILMLFATLGMMLMVSASDLLSLYVGLELQSLSLYVLAAFRRDNIRSSEAGLKYFVLGALSSGILLYGISLLYGYAGTTEFVNLSYRLKSMHPVPLGIIFGCVFLCSGLAFKVSAVPFHMWTPDVYEGAPTPITAYFASAPKMAALALFARVLILPLSGLSHQWVQIVVFIAAASMLLGSFAGLKQSNIKRLMAYSSIANVGFALVAIAAFVTKPGVQALGIQALLIYLSIYFLNTLGAFSVVLCMRRDGQAVEDVADLAGLARRDPMVALAMSIFMFSLAGVPPLAGFFGKYFVFLAAVKADMVSLAVLGVLTSVVSSFYYLRIIKIMYFDDSKAPLDPLPSYSVGAVLTVTALFMIGFTIWPSIVVDQALMAAKSITGG